MNVQVSAVEQDILERDCLQQHFLAVLLVEVSGVHYRVGALSLMLSFSYIVEGTIGVILEILETDHPNRRFAGR